MKFKKKVKKLLILTGIVLAIGLTVGCSKKEAIPVASSEIETVQETQDPYSLDDKDVDVTQPTEIVGTLEDNSATLSTTPDGETQADFGIYGPLGQSFYDGIVWEWVNWYIEDEPALRAYMDEVYDALPTKEQLTSQILALQRNPNPSTQQAGLSETQPTQETKVAQETKSQPSKPKETTPAPVQQTQPAPQAQQQETQPAPAPTQQTTPPASHGTTPGGIPLTGDPVYDAMILEGEQNTTNDTAKPPMYDVSEDVEGLQWN